MCVSSPGTPREERPPPGRKLSDERTYPSRESYLVLLVIATGTLALGNGAAAVVSCLARHGNYRPQARGATAPMVVNDVTSPGLRGNAAAGRAVPEEPSSSSQD